MQTKAKVFKISGISGYKFLKEIQLEADQIAQLNGSYDVKIVLETVDKDGTAELVARFFGAVEIKIGNLRNGRCILLNIEDVSGNQLEGINYRVSDEEGDVFSFCCRDISVGNQ